MTSNNIPEIENACEFCKHSFEYFPGEDYIEISCKEIQMGVFRFDTCEKFEKKGD